VVSRTVSTTIRVDRETHDRLLQISAESGTTLTETVRVATEALRRQRFGERVAREVDALRRDRAAWQEYLDEAASTDVTDGVG
jgi:predicted DNA-binding protein